ncbi:MAG: ABC transporter ATP-binding protein, partial [Actinomycetota bacterium]
RDLGVTTVYVTHDQVEAMTMGDRVAVLKDGYLQQVDSPQNLYDKPDNVFVAAFIGSPSMNLHEASLSGTTLTLGSHSIELPASVFEKRPGLKAFDGKSLIVGFRPEDLEDSTLAPDEKKGGSFSTTVTLTEALGSEIIVHFDLDAPKVDAGDPDAVDDLGDATAVGRFDPRSRVMIGDTVEIAVNTINLHFFDPEARTAIW